MATSTHIAACSSAPVGNFYEAFGWIDQNAPKWFIVDNYFRGSSAYNEGWGDDRGGGTFWVDAGEECKSLATAERALSWLSDQGATRGDTVAVIGGGTVLDLGLFVAAIFQRGMTAWCVPTTLLASVDAGIGGKNGLNFRGLKNYIGTIAQPEIILTDYQVLNSLPALHVLNGWMEMAKHGLIESPALWSKMSGFDAIPLPASMHELIADAADIKKQIVARDERESGERKKLNFGHTLAHALESRAAFLGRDLPHGVAVGIGLVFSLHWSAARANSSPQRHEMHAAATTVLEWLKVGAHELLHQTLSDFDAQSTWTYMQKDKKNAENTVLEVALHAVGEAHWNVPMTREEFDAAWSEAFGR